MLMNDTTFLLDESLESLKVRLYYLFHVENIFLILEHNLFQLFVRREFMKCKN